MSVSLPVEVPFMLSPRPALPWVDSRVDLIGLGGMQEEYNTEERMQVSEAMRRLAYESGSITIILAMRQNYRVNFVRAHVGE